MESEKEDESGNAKTGGNRVVSSVCLYLAFTSLGVSAGLLGPSLVHLTYLYDTDIAWISFAYTSDSIGYLSGSILCALLFDRANHEMQFVIACLVVGIMMSSAPWMPHLYGFFACVLCQNVGLGFIDAAGQSYIIGIWQGHRRKGPATQCAHGLWAVGAFIGPQIVRLFLVDLPKLEPNTDYNYSSSTAVDTTLIITTPKKITEIEGLTRVRYPFAIIGAIFGISSIAFLIAFLTVRNRVELVAEKDEEKNSPSLGSQGNPSSFKYPMMVMVFLFFFCYAWYETIPGGMLSALVIKGLEWPVQDGPKLTSLFWAAHGTGSIVGIPMSIWLNPTKRLVMNLLITMTGFVLMVFTPSMADIMLWISVIIAGFGMSTTFVSGVLWISNHMTITGAMGAMFLMATSGGSMTAAPTVGYLFKSFSYMWVIYLSLLACCVHILIFTGMYSFTVLYKKYPVKDSEDINIKITDVTEMNHLNSEETAQDEA